MINIQRDALLNREIRFLFPITQESENLCIYFWQTVWAFVACVSVGLLALGAILTLPILFLLEIFFGIDANIVLDSSRFLTLFCFLGIMMWGASLISLIMFATTKALKAMSPTKSYSSPNIFIEYVKAKKDKFCPRINFYEQD